MTDELNELQETADDIQKMADDFTALANCEPFPEHVLRKDLTTARHELETLKQTITNQKVLIDNIAHACDGVIEDTGIRIPMMNDNMRGRYCVAREIKTMIEKGK